MAAPERIAWSVRRPRALQLALAAILLVLACAAPREEARTGSRAALVDLHDLQELRSRFNADAGVPRLVLLVSPT